MSNVADNFRRVDGKSNKVISKARIVSMVDDSPDTSMLGEYSNTPGPFAIDRERLGDCGSSHEYTYFNPCYQNYKGLSDRTIKKYCKKDYERMESLNNGNWYFMGIWAECTYTINGVIQKLSSGGLWGIDSDAGDGYIKEIEGEQYAELVEIVKSLGLEGLPSFEDMERKGVKQC